MSTSNDLLARCLPPMAPQSSSTRREANSQLYHDARALPDDQLRSLLTGPKPLRFDWENKWLRGDQYAHMLNNIDAYCAAFGMAKHGEKQHPENIYTQPESKCSCDPPVITNPLSYLLVSLPSNLVEGLGPINGRQGRIQVCLRFKLNLTSAITAFTRNYAQNRQSSQNVHFAC